MSSVKRAASEATLNAKRHMFGKELGKLVAADELVQFKEELHETQQLEHDPDKTKQMKTATAAAVVTGARAEHVFQCIFWRVRWNLGTYT